MVAAKNQKAKTFTIASKEKPRVFKVTDKTAITKSGKPATMTDIAENEEVSGSYWKNADGTLEAKTVKLRPVEKATTSTASPAPSPKP
jgi:20S proteasome alpha/beta subunit